MIRLKTASLGIFLATAPLAGEALAGVSATPAWTAESNQTSAFFGGSVASAGDVNGDGFSDVIVGANGYANGQASEGRAYVYLGSPSGLSISPAWVVESDRANAQFGGSVASAGDVNGDGYSDVIVGALDYGNDQAQEGRAYLYLGSASGLATSPAWIAEGDLTSARFGTSVASAGDVNGDGYSDVIVGAEYYQNGQVGEGRAFVYLGSASGLGPSPAWIAESDQVGAHFGQVVSTAGDVNGDGYSDVLVGAHDYDNGQTSEGGAWLYLGSASGLASSPAWTAEGNQEGALFGSVASAGDVNGDGYSDVVVGAIYYDGAWFDSGQAFVYLGAASGLATSPAWTATTLGGGGFGWSVGTAGDLNGDGYSDLVVGAHNYDTRGRVFIYLGSASGLDFSHAWVADGNQMHATFGGSVVTAGNVNGDGYSDVIVGARGYDNGQGNEGRALVYHGGPQDCFPPDQPTLITAMTRGAQEFAILHFQDPNDPIQVYGYNIYRTDTPSLRPGGWFRALDVSDMDATTPDKQWVDASFGPPSGGVWYYRVAAYNRLCEAEGPW